MLYDRLVLHHQTSPQAVEDFIECIREMVHEVAQNGEKEVNKVGKSLGGEQLEKEKSEGKLRKQAALGY